jgi:hypothetical protein
MPERSHPCKFQFFPAALLLIGLALLLLTGCSDQPVLTGTLINGGSYRVAAGETRASQVLLASGELAVEAGGVLDGSIVLVEGSARLDGRVSGDVIMLGGQLDIGPQAELAGDLRHGGGSLRRDPNARLEGDFNQGMQIPELLSAQLLPNIRPPSVWERLLRPLALCLLAFVALRYRPVPFSRMARAAGSHWFVCLSLGVLSGVAALALLVMMAFTILLIPVALFGLVLLGAAVVAGWFAYGVLLGRGLERISGERLKPLPARVLGIYLLLVALNFLPDLPLLGGTLALLVSAAGLGAVLLTRAGSRDFVPSSYASSADPLLPQEDFR